MCKVSAEIRETRIKVVWFGVNGDWLRLIRLVLMPLMGLGNVFTCMGMRVAKPPLRWAYIHI